MKYDGLELPLGAHVQVDVVESGHSARRGRTVCQIDTHINFSTSGLESYCVARWEPVLFDALVVAAAVEFCDRLQPRRAQQWGRVMELRVAVHDPDRWSAKPVTTPLTAALDLLTGDHWILEFVARQKPAASPRQLNLEVPDEGCTVIPFSDGLDSCAVAGLLGRTLGNRLVRVRVGRKRYRADFGESGARQPFSSVPYRVAPETRRQESSARSRGFKFSTVTGLAAYMLNAKNVVISESGQGALGPALAPVGQVYEDYRNHPLFAERMMSFLGALLGKKITFTFPRLWFTKGETLAEFIRAYPEDASWSSTWSCWQSSRQVSIAGKHRQCGVCAACMLRRLSVHAAGLFEVDGTYAWDALSAPTFEAGAAEGLKRVTKAQREYAIAGTLHLKNLATLRRDPASRSTIDLAVNQLSQALSEPESAVRDSLARLLHSHEREWEQFLEALGPGSFVAEWAA